jgi:hypothetical protein
MQPLLVQGLKLRADKRAIQQFHDGPISRAA